MSSFDLTSRPVQVALVSTALCASLLYGLLVQRRPRKLKIHPGLPSSPTTELQMRAYHIYPKNLHGDGAYVTLPFGKVKYWLVGPSDGKKVVLIHGLTIPSLAFRDLTKILVKNGFQVLLFDLYGRGYTDAPETTYNAQLYITQTALLMQYVKWGKAYIVGFSMGGAIAGAFAATFPHLVDGRIVFIASAGAIRPTGFSTQQMIMMSSLGRMISKSVVVRSWLYRSIVQRAKNAVGALTPSQELGEIVGLQTVLLPGYSIAIGSSLADGPLRNQDESFKKIGAQLTKVLLIWGTDDPIVPVMYADVLKRYMPQAEVIKLEGGLHDVTVTHPEEIGAALVKFFR